MWLKFSAIVLLLNFLAFVKEVESIARLSLGDRYLNGAMQKFVHIYKWFGHCSSLPSHLIVAVHNCYCTHCTDCLMLSCHKVFILFSFLFLQRHRFNQIRQGVKHFADQSAKYGSNRLNVEVDVATTPYENLFLEQYHRLPNPLYNTGLGDRLGIYDRRKHYYLAQQFYNVSRWLLYTENKEISPFQLQQGAGNYWTGTSASDSSNAGNSSGDEGSSFSSQTSGTGDSSGQSRPYSRWFLTTVLL